MDYNLETQLLDLCNKQIELALVYQKEVDTAVKAQQSIDTLMVAKLGEFKAEKPNLGIEMARLMLMESTPEARGLYVIADTAKGKEKGLNKLIGAYQNKIWGLMRLLKWKQSGEMTGGNNIPLGSKQHAGRF